MSLLFDHVDKPVMLFWALIVAIPLYVFSAKIWFDDYDGFIDALTYWFQPQWLSMLKGEWHEDNWQSLKFMFFLLTCFCCLIGVYKMLKWLF